MELSPEKMDDLIQTLRWRHRCLDSQASHILPSLLQQADQIVDGQHDVADDLILGHSHVSYRHSQAQNLFQLEFDG
jgi:hypothetical protein